MCWISARRSLEEVRCFCLERNSSILAAPCRSGGNTCLLRGELGHFQEKLGGGTYMLQRRLFVGCALCSISALAATAVAAQTPAPATPGIKRKILQQTDGPMPGYVTVFVDVEIDAGTTVARHTHPGVESSFVTEGNGELLIDGQPSRPVGAGDGFQVPVAVPHSFRNSDKPTRLAVTYIVEKGKPLASPA